jgi:hypothetical protein
MKLILGFVLLATVGCSTPRRPEPPKDSYKTGSVVLTLNGGKQTLSVARVRRTFFQPADAAPLLGRLLLPAEYDNGAAVVLLSEQLWRDSFGASPSIIGTRIQVGGDLLTVVGILPKSFDSPPGAAIWLPRTDSIVK